MQVIQERGIGENIGTGLGTGIGQGLQQLASHKMNQLQQRHAQMQSAQGLQSLGIPRQEASQLSMLPKELQSVIVKNYLQGAESLGLEQALAGLGGQGAGQAQQLPVSQVPGAQQQNVQSMGQQGQQQQPAKQERSFADILKNPRLKPEQRLKVEALMQKKEHFEKTLGAAEQRAVDKETLPIYKEIHSAAKDAKENDKRLGRMEALVKKGNLTPSALASVLKTVSHGVFGVGLDLHWLEHPDSQEFTKLSNEFLKNAKGIFGGRVTNNEVDAFMRMVPTLLQSDEGKLRIINNMKAGNKAAEIRKKALDEIVKENHGKRPANLESLIEERAGKQLDALADEFKEGYGDNSQNQKNESLTTKALNLLPSPLNKLATFLPSPD